MSQKILILFTNIFLFVTAITAQQYPEIVKVKGGSFKMGDELGLGQADEQPVHIETVRKFGIAKTETTVLQWKTYCKATGKQMPKSQSGEWMDNHPITSVSWEEAAAYCLWLSQKTGKQYRLPTETEWEFAARGGNQSKGFTYSGGHSIDSTSWCIENSNTSTHAIAQKKANELGLYDMSGNVWEWCQDWYLFKASEQNNPQLANKGTTRVLRGGCAKNPASSCRVAERGSSLPDYRDPFLGFRVALEL
jgi:sulfatase modifying factor 1